jgi:hypothetical protein
MGVFVGTIRRFMLDDANHIYSEPLHHETSDSRLMGAEMHACFELSIIVAHNLGLCLRMPKTSGKWTDT